MTEKPNYFKLGVFILIAVALMIGGLLIFGSGAFAKGKIYYETYFADSISGLTKGSVVELNGVKIGVVEKVSFVRRSYDLQQTEKGISPYDMYVRVILSANEEQLPRSEIQGRDSRLREYIAKGLRLRMASNIITGQAYLQAVFLDPERFPPIDIPWKPEYTYVPSAPSSIITLKESVDQILKKLGEIQYDQVADNLNKLLVTLNQAVVDAEIKILSQKMQTLLVDADQAVLDADIKDVRAKAVTLIEELRQSNSALKALISKPDPEMELDNIPILIDEFSRTLSSLERQLETEEPEVKRILNNIRQLTENLNYLSERLKDNPSELLFSVPPKKREN